MYVLGFNGGFDLAPERKLVLGEDATHDASAVLLHDGAVVAAIEEERLTRIKHCAKFPRESMRFCINAAGITISEIDHFAFFTSERFADYYLNLIYLNKPWVHGPPTYRDFFRSMIHRAFGVEIDTMRLHFVQHHLAHAASAQWASQMEDCLIVVLDGQGETNSGLIARCRRGELEVLESVPVGQSLGYMYLSTIRLLGYWNGDEYKAMGLAPHGDPERYRRVFELCYKLLDGGRYVVDEAAICASLLRFCQPRRRNEPFTREHRDIAAGLQATLETIVLHVLSHYRGITGLRSLALAGGVAHNCSMNGKILRSGLFDEVFVHPASYDPGCAMGAAQWVSAKMGVAPVKSSTSTMFLGSDAENEIESQLSHWSEFIEIRFCDDIEGHTANALAANLIVGWVQGRSEFGPRALGGRNILADPRPVANRDRVNQTVKKREGYRPFAPAVIAERAADFFDLSGSVADHRFMSFAVPVRPEKREYLGAVTHVDGTARLQIVERAYSPRFWRLLSKFGELTSVPVLLSTSFNNDVEPIVETINDAIVCFLTTSLNNLVIGQYWISRKPGFFDVFCKLVPFIPEHVSLNTQVTSLSNAPDVKYFAALSSKYNAETVLSAAELCFLNACDGVKTVEQVLQTLRLKGVSLITAENIFNLWSQRLITMTPSTAQTRG